MREMTIGKCLDTVLNTTKHVFIWLYFIVLCFRLFTASLTERSKLQW